MRSTPVPKIAPGPRGHPLLGSLLEFRRDVLGMMQKSARQYGDIVRFRIGPHVVHLVNHPDLIEQVLQTNHRNYNKATRSSAKLKSICGDSLLTSNGQSWQCQRQLLQPMFHRQSVAAFASLMTQAAADMLARWQPHAANGKPLDVASEMMGLTYTIVGKTLFGADLSTDAKAVEDSMGSLLAHTYGRWGRILDLPDRFPSPANLRFRRALQAVDRIVYRLIAEHRSRATDRAGMLSLLLEVRDEQTGQGLSDEQVRNQTITFLLAGHETTANALAWTFYLLSQDPNVECQLRAELAEVLDGRIPTVEDMPRLKYTAMVVQESMRLYPPIWAMERNAIGEDVLGGYHIPSGSSVVISPYLLHRHPAFWQEPERFDPERFLHPPRVAYIPFGAGPRHCIGSEFAMMEARLIVSMVVQAFHLELVPGLPVEPKPGITLRTRHGLWMRLHNVPGTK